LEPDDAMTPRILVLYNEPVLPADHPEAGSEHDIHYTVAGAGKVLVAAGFDVRKLGISYDPRPLLDELRGHPPDAVFNLFEGLATQTSTEVSVAALLEWLNVPFTGCPSTALALGRDKVRTKHLLAAAGIPTPEYLVIEDAPVPVWAGGWPAIVKPACQDASVGIDQSSVVTTQEQLDERVRYVLRNYGPPVLVERYVPGREFHVNMVEDGATADRPGALIVLPLAEIVFRHTDPACWNVYTFAAKWYEESEEFKASPLVSPVTLPPAETARLSAVASRAYRLLGCRDYARVDVRMSPEGEFYVLEVNPNPYLDSLALVNGLEAIGRTHEQLLVDMTLAALARGGKEVPPGTIRVPVGVSVVE
jgi:D-alanine-D-alanine ligase